jgi:hypothetical protein
LTKICIVSSSAARELMLEMLLVRRIMACGGAAWAAGAMTEASVALGRP